MSRPKLKDRKWVKALGSIGKGLLKDPLMLISSPIVGAAAGVQQGLKEIKQDNKNDETGGHGKPSYQRWIGFIISCLVLVVMVLSLTGVLDPETAEGLNEALKDVREGLPLDTL